MKVIRAAEMGMCFGVRDALEAARAIAEAGRVTIHGELVHNRQVLDELAGRGFHMSPEVGRDVPPTPDILITAHGVSERERTRLIGAGKRLQDTTCPLVRFVDASARRLEREGRFVVVIGRRDHVEVQGIVGDLTRFAVVEQPEEARDYPAARLGIVCQSTVRPDAAERVRHAVATRNPGRDIVYVDTICGPTRNRQAAAEALLSEVEALVVVGGRHSNNTRELVRLAETRGVPALHVEGAADLDPIWLGAFEVVGLTAGTSTLDGAIDQVHEALLAPARR